MTPHRSRLSPRIAAWIALALLVGLFAQLAPTTSALSLTIDEGFHMTSGLEYLRTGRLQLFDEHTPLAKALFAWPLLLIPDLPPPETASGYAAGNLIEVTQNTLLAYRPLDRPVVASRLAVALLTVLLAALIYRWGADAFGPAGGLLALSLAAFDPNLLAHGSLATTDLGATLFIFLAVLAFERYLRRPTAPRWILAALALGLAQGAKLTALMLFPVLGLALLVTLGRSPDRSPRAWGRALLSFAGMTLTAGLIVWALYGFELRPVPGIAGGTWPIPAPGHVERWLRLQENLQYGREAFLLGQNRMHGWWQYFPLALALKTPLPTLLLVFAIPIAAWAGVRRSATTELLLLLFPLLYGLASLTSPLNIGYRHLLPILPFAFVSAGRLAAVPLPPLKKLSWVKVPVLGLCLIGWVGGTLRLAPHYLTFFNALAGGPANGWRFLADSNTDWGQALKVLAAYQQEHPEPVRLSLFTFLDPAAYGVRYTPIAPMRDAPPVLPQRFAPASGRYVLSATTLDGVPLPVPSTYDWFRHREPQRRFGNALFLYDIPETPPAAWIAQCTVPAVPLDEAGLNEGFGTPPARRITFDCEQSWVWPAGGRSAGYYARTAYGIDTLRWPDRSQRLEWWPTWIPRAGLAPLQLSYVQPTPGSWPPFALWKWPAGSPQVPAPALEGSVTLGESLEFLGFTLPAAIRPGETGTVVTWWRVLTPPARPLSLMLHLRAADGTAAAVGDGLGFSIEQWQPGDLIAQRHTLILPPAAPSGPYTLHTGAYWLDDLSPLPLAGKAEVLQAPIPAAP